MPTKRVSGPMVTKNAAYRTGGQVDDDRDQKQRRPSGSGAVQNPNPTAVQAFLLEGEDQIATRGGGATKGRSLDNEQGEGYNDQLPIAEVAVSMGAKNTTREGHTTGGGVGDRSGDVRPETDRHRSMGGRIRWGGQAWDSKERRPNCEISSCTVNLRHDEGRRRLEVEDLMAG
jgi:hypothetical protein